MPEGKNNDAAQWWKTGIIRIEPGTIEIRGYKIEELIGRVSFVEQIWLMLRGELPNEREAALLEAALVAAVDHGPQAPSIAIARMSATCGTGINNAMASAINALGDVHGGAGQQAMELYDAIVKRIDAGEALGEASGGEVRERLAKGRLIEGFGHRFHPVDPRAVRLMGLVDDARRDGHIRGCYAEIGLAVEAALAKIKSKPIPMNIDGVTAVIFCELGFPPELGRGLFILSRSVGILAHTWEQFGQGARIKGPMPPSVPFCFTGRSSRRFEKIVP